MIIFISSLETINVTVREVKSEGQPDSNIFLWIAASNADAAAFNPNGIKTLLVNDLSTFFIKDKPLFSNGSKRLPINPPNYPILCKWVFSSFILAEKLSAKALRSFKTRVVVNNNLCRKLFLSLESSTTFDEIFKATLISVPEVPFRFFDKLKNAIQSFILTVYFYFNQKDEIQIIDYRFHV